MQGELGGGYGAASHYFWIYSGGAPAYNSAERLQVALLRVLYRHDDHGGGTVDDAAGVTGGYCAVFSERRLQLGETFHGGLGAAMVVFGEHLTSGFALGVFESDGDEFLLQASGLVSVLGTLLGAESVFILHLTGDALLLGIKLGGIGHVEAAIAIKQGDHQRIFELAAGGEGEAVAAANYEWSLRHGFHAAGEHDLGFSQLHHLGGADDGLHAGAAEPVDGERGSFNGEASAQADVAGAVESITRGLLSVSENGVIEFAGGEAGALDSAFGSHGAQFHGSEIFELAAVTAHRRASAADNRNLACF